MQFKKRDTLKAAYAKNEVPESQFIPYEGHFDSNVVITKNEELVLVIKLEGFSFETADDEDLDIRKNVRNTLFKSIGSGSVALWFHTIRRRITAHIGGEFETKFSEILNEQWVEKHSDSVSFKNELYITIVNRVDKTGAAANISDIFGSLAKKADKEMVKSEIRNRAKELHEMGDRVVGSLRDYKPRLLGIRETQKGHFSEVMEFLGMLVNGAQHTPMLVPFSDASHYLPTCRKYFGNGAVEIRTPKGESRFGAIVSVQEYAPTTYAGVLDVYLQLPFELIITQSFLFINRHAAVSKMTNQQRRMASAGDKAVSQMLEITEAMDMTSGGHIGFGEHHMTVLALTDDFDSLDKAVSLCYGKLVDAGINPVREKLNFQASYWGQLPGNFDMIARGSTINTLNLSGFASLHNYPTGQKDGNHWGDAVTLFDTTSGTPFYFNFHVRDVGHTTIIGPTGAGKTVTMNFLMAQAQKYNPRMFFFDKDRGAEIFIRAIGGVYAVIKPMGQSDFNPLQLSNNQENRTFVAEWLRTLVLTTHNVPLTPEENDLIGYSVSGNYKMPPEKRRLRNIIPFLGLEGPGSLASRMKIWHGQETHAGLFDNKRDSLDFTKARVFGFEMAKVLSDGISLGPVLLYLFHKINISLDGTPTIIVLDEAWALIDNEIFAPKIKDWLKVLRKLNAFVIFATQSVEDVSKSTISDTLVQQTATQIFLPNAKGTVEYKNTFMLSDREFQLIKTTDPGSRFFLVKQGDDVVVARIDLSGMDDVINVLSGRADTVLLLDEIRDEVGENPEDWLPVFCERVREIV
jgi:type IV secretion system protein VirB4